MGKILEKRWNNKDSGVYGARIIMAHLTGCLAKKERPSFDLDYPESRQRHSEG